MVRRPKQVATPDPAFRPAPRAKDSKRSRRAVFALVAGVLLTTGCGSDAEADPNSEAGSDGTMLAALFEGTGDYCALPPMGVEVLASAPTSEATAVDDVNWFARPVLHDGSDFIIAFASHDQNYLYNLSTDERVQIPDRSDAVATPDGRYMTVPSNYTPDSTTRFYDVEPMLAALESDTDIADLEPVFVHDRPDMKRVYYQSTARVSEVDTDSGTETVYRLMFSGTGDRSPFRIADYLFRHHGDTGELLDVVASEPMAICPEIQNDLNTPFISKDGKYVAAYTSPEAGNAWTSGASLKVFEITGTDPAAGTTSCREVADLGFAAGKADFSFDGSMLTFHLSQGGYLTPFVNGGISESTITDVMVARFTFDGNGTINGVDGLQRLSTSLEAGVGSYFPAFFPDGNLFYLSNTVPRESEEEKRFLFHVVDPTSRGWRTSPADAHETMALWTELGALWQRSCQPRVDALGATPFPLDEHELPLQAMALNVPQCAALVRDAREADPDSDVPFDRLASLCKAVEAGQ